MPRRRRFEFNDPVMLRYRSRLKGTTCFACGRDIATLDGKPMLCSRCNRLKNRLSNPSVPMTTRKGRTL